MTAEASLRRAARIVARAERVPVRDVLKARGWSAKRRRHLASYLAVVGFNQPLKRVARAAGVGAYTLRGAIGRIEDQRSSPEFDAWLTQLEEQTCAA